MYWSLFYVFLKIYGPSFYFYIMPSSSLKVLMGEGFILLTWGYGFMGGVYHPPFDTLKKGTFAYDMNLKLYR